MSVVSRVRFAESGMDGMKIFVSDFGWMETYREQELIKRFQAMMKTPGVIAETYEEDKLFPSSGVSDNFVYVSPGTAAVASGGLVELNGTFSFAVSSGDVGKWVVAEFQTMNIDARQHRETGNLFYMREVPTSGVADVFYLTTTSPAANTDNNIIYLGKITGYDSGKPVIDISEDNRELFSVFSGVAHTFTLWLYNLLKDEQSDFEDFVNTRYDQLVTLLTGKEFPDGTFAQTTSNIPNPPKNLRIRNIGPTRISTDSDIIDDTTVEVTREAARGWVQGKAKVKIEWNWNDVVGTGGVNSFTTTSTKDRNENEYSFTANELVGYHLYVGGTDYIISANAATSGGSTVLTVTDVNGNNVDLTGVSGTPTTPAIIHSNADEYIITLTPITNYSPGPPVQHPEESDTILSHFSASPVSQKKTLLLDLKTRYEIKVKARIGTNTSSALDMQSGQYTKFAVANTYDEYPLIKLPDIPISVNALGLTSTTQGFNLAITGYATSGEGMPGAFEIAWTTDPGNADFDNQNHNVEVLYGNKKDIVTPISATYNVAIRPLQAGQVVGARIDESVVSGAQGRLPNEKLLPYIYVDLFPDIQVVNVISSGATEWVLQPSGSVDWAVSRFVGKRLTDSVGNMFEITKSTSNQVTIAKIANDFGELADLNTASAVYIGDTGPTDDDGLPTFSPKQVRDRKIYEHDFLNDVFITRVQFDCEFTNGTQSVPVVVRLYQSGRPSFAKTFEVNAPETIFTEVIELDILGAHGNRRLIIDAWDSTGFGNTKRVKGTLTVFYRDKSQIFDDAVETSTTRSTL